MRLRRLIPVLLLLAAGLCLAQPAITPIAPGVTYEPERLADGPWEVRVIRVDRGAEFIGLDMALGMGRLRGVEPLSGMIARETAAADYVVAGVNADFFTMAGNPYAGLCNGLTVKRGELIMTARGRPAFAMMRDGTPRLGVFDTSGTLVTPTGELPLGGLNEPPIKDALTAYSAVYGWPLEGGCVVLKAEGLPLTVNGEWRGQVAEIVPPGTSREAGPDELLLHADGAARTSLAGLRVGEAVTIALRTPGLDGPVEMAAGGNVELLREGRVLVEPNPRDPRHPRTLVGYNDRQIIFVTVDGRQAGWSVGMTYHELALLMQRLGCAEALNLDGGGSTTCWVRGQVTNRPSDGGERRIANAILVRSRAPHGPLARLLVRPPRIVALAGARVPLTLTGTDQWHNPVALAPSDLRLSIFTHSGKPGRITASRRGDTLEVSGPPGQALVSFAVGDKALAELPVRLVGRCARVEVTPAVVVLCASETAQLTVRGVSVAGETVWLPPEAVRWSVAGSGLAVSASGEVSAASPGVAGLVTVLAGRGMAQAGVRVAAETVLEGFEEAPAVTFATAPESDGVTGGVEVLTGDAGQGRRFCRLTYDLGQPQGTRAAYARLDRPLGTALRLSLMARGTGSAPAWLRVAVVDGNGTRLTYTLAEALDWSGWRRVAVRLPDGLKAPLRWESVYVVATEGKTGKGTMDLDDLRVEAIAD